MVKLKRVGLGDLEGSDSVSEPDDDLVLIDDASFVDAFAAASQRRGNHLVCVRCAIAQRPLRALVLLLDGGGTDRECAGSLGFCCECYRDLTELMLHEAILNATKLP